MDSRPSDAPTYRALLRVSGFGRLAGATLVARTGATMQSLVLILFVLARYGSAPLAGLVVFLSLVPGLVVSPIAGALLDRHRRMLLIKLDYAVAAAALCAIAALDSAHILPVPALLSIVAVGSLTSPLSNSGTRSLFPIMVPRALWERANAVDSGAYVLAAIAGPAVAGVLIGVLGAGWALVATAALYVVGLVLLLGMAEPVLERMATTSLVGDAWAGLRYVVSHRELRGLAVTTAVSNIAFGILSVAMPVLMLGPLHSTDAGVGAMYAVLGVAGLVSSVISGRMDSERREVWFIVVGCAFSVLSMTTLFLAASVGGGVLVVGLGVALFGIGNGPYDIGLFSLRQRVTAPAWMGRAFAVSMSLNFIGMPVGSALGGPVVDHSIPAGFAIAIAAAVCAGVASLVMLRPRDPGASSNDGAPSLSSLRPEGGRRSPVAAE